MVEITRFNPVDLSELQSLIHLTIKTCYPKVYHSKVVNFFLDYHSSSNILNRAKNAFVFVLRIEGEIKGTGFLSGSELGGVYVHPDFQKKGYAKMIVEHILQIAKNNGLSTIHLDSTPLAKNMYEKMNFYVTENAVQMVDDVPLPYYKMEKHLYV